MRKVKINSNGLKTTSMHKKYLPHQTPHRSPCPGLYRMPMAADGHICRIKLEQGRISSCQWRILAQAAADDGNGIIEITTRANIQLRGVKSSRIDSLSHILEQAGFAPKDPNGDDVRNVMVHPTAGFDRRGDKRILALAQEISTLLQINRRYQTLSPKFSLLLDGGEACAMLHHHHDIWLCICDGGKNIAFGLASRPPLVAETQKTHVTLGKVAFAKGKELVFALVDLLLDVRFGAPEITRMKHLVKVMEVKKIVGFLANKGVQLQPAADFYRERIQDFSYLGIHETAKNSRFYLGVKAPLGRLTPHSCTLLADLADKTAANHIMRLTPWQGIIFPDCRLDEAQKLADTLMASGFISDVRQPLARMMCCCGLDACHSARADVRRDAHFLAHALEKHPLPLIHLSACGKSCAANEATPITLVAVNDQHYDLFVANQDTTSRFGHKQASNITIDEAKKFLLQQAQQSP